MRKDRNEEEFFYETSYLEGLPPNVIGILPPNALGLYLYVKLKDSEKRAEENKKTFQVRYVRETDSVHIGETPTNRSLGLFPKTSRPSSSKDTTPKFYDFASSSKTT